MSRPGVDEEFDLMETLDILMRRQGRPDGIGIRTIEELEERIRDIEMQLAEHDGPV